MATNPYAGAPLCIAQVDPSTGHHVRAFYFLGETPKAVLEAAQRARPSRGDPRCPEWAAADGATLRGFYGGQWRALLTPEDPPPEEPLSLGLAQSTQGTFRSARLPLFFTGGAEEGLEFGNLDELDTIEATEGEQGPATHTPGQENYRMVNHSAGVPIYTDIAVYPEDTIYDLRLKLCAASEVPLYRQHFFYYVNEEGPTVPYRFMLDGAPVLADWRSLILSSAQERAVHQATVVAGITVDPRHEARRDGIRIEALDTFTLLSPAPGVQITRAYYIDLFTVIPPLSSPGRPNDGLAAILRDRYQFDLLYYGGLLRYWPQLSPDACSIALSAPGRLAASYPALDPDPAVLHARFAAERTIANRALSWRPTAAKGARQETAVTAATVRITPNAVRMRVAVRNIFDWIPTGLAVAAVRARFDIDANLLPVSGVAAAGPEARQGGMIPIIGTKRHATSFNPRASPTINWFVGRLPHRDSVTFALAREGPSDEEFSQTGAGRQIPYAYLTVFADGRTEAMADWREDDRVGFEAITAEIATVVGPTISAINDMGAAAFPIGGVLTPPGRPGTASPALIALGAITVSAFWPHALTAAAFRELKSRFRIYEKAGIVGIRGLQQAGAYTFTFRKGVVAYDPRLADRLADRAEASAPARPDQQRAAMQNQYAWLTDGSVAARWAATFQGRMVRIHHRVTDLRIEILGADSLAEFETIRRYVFSFLDGLLRGPDRIRTGEAQPPAKSAPRAENPSNKESDAPHRLRRLQERDPNLFDLKKYDQGATVYSVLCQSGRQPHIHNGAELAALGAKRRAALVRYWNFTENEPAFYECPDPKFPHLSFRAGQHPLGYCLPCCKKSRAAVGSRAALVNEGCLARRARPGALEDEDETAMSRHVLTYGKAIPAGRISDLPREVGEGLFLGALPRPYRLQMIGIEQSAPAIPNAGFAYALAFAIGLGGDTIDEVLSELAGLAAEMGDTYYALGRGGGAAFASGRDLGAAILSAFVHRDANLSPFGPGGAAATSWPDILADLARHVYGVEVVVLVDLDGAGTVSVEATPEAAVAITSMGRCGESTVARPRIALLAVGPGGTYPVAALDPNFYLRVAPSSRWMAARRTFGDDPPQESVADFVVDHIADVVRGVLGSHDRRSAGAAELDLGLITRWGCAAGSNPAFILEGRLVNLHNMCYGVFLRRSADAGLAYIPVRQSAYTIDGTPTVFGPRPSKVLPATVLAAAVADINRFIAAAGEPYALIERAATIVDNSGRAVGFVTSGSAPLHFFHDAGPAEPDGVAVIRFPYDSREVDLAIVASLQKGAGGDSTTATRAAEADVRNRLYRLFLAEFSAVLRAERNEGLRAQLVAALKSTQYELATSVAALRRRLTELLCDYPDDLQIVRSAVARAYVTAPQGPGGAAIAAIAATSFTFDRRTMARLRALGSHEETVGALRALMAPRVTTSADVAGRALVNMYVSCAEKSAVHGTTRAGLCAGHRLAVPADRIDDFYDILAADVRNPGKTGLLAAISAGVLNSLDFIRRPGEHLDIVLSGR